MEIGEIIPESFRYPFNISSNFFKVAALFVLFVIPAIFSTITLFSNNVILEIIFGICLTIPILRLANHDSLSETLSFSAIREDLNAISISKFILLYIIFAIIAFAILFIGIFMLLIPIIGAIIFLMVIVPYIYLATAYGFGLLYSDVV